jgi:plasmid stabilization system protein ParE
MTYRVVFQRLAVQDLDDAFVWAARKAPATAARWLDRFQAALQRLDTNPQRCPRVREQRKVDIDLREILFGKAPNVYRAIFHDRRRHRSRASHPSCPAATIDAEGDRRSQRQG